MFEKLQADYQRFLAVDAAFIAYVTGPNGQAILAKYGFMKP